MKKRTIKRMAISLVSVALLYFIFFSIIIFSYNKDVSLNYMEEHKPNRFFSDKVGPDRAIIVDTPKYASVLRINMIQNAKETIDISYYSMEKGSSTEFFFGLLLDAADRGVNVRIVLDGIANGVKSKQKDIMYALKNHPNVEFKLYEPINILKPWTINNRLHDKYIIMDNKVLILGGRNIGDRFWGPENFNGELTYDRDILVYNSDESSSESVLVDIANYFEKVFNSEFAKDPVKSLSAKKKEIANKRTEELRVIVDKVKNGYSQVFFEDINWIESTYPTNNVTLIHNPITRFSKEPWVLYEIVSLMKKADKYIFIQSPYIVPPKGITDYAWHEYIKKDVRVDILTNSLATTPNFPAFSSYLRHRDEMIKSGYNIYEYNGENSIHSKSYMFDNRLTLVGSYNLDPRSSFLSTETMIVVDSLRVAEEFEKIKQGYIDRSLLIGPDGEYIIGEGNITPREYGKGKEILLKLVGIFTIPFEYLL